MPDQPMYCRIPISSAGVIGTPVLDGLAAVANTSMGNAGAGDSSTVSVYGQIDFAHTGDGKTVAGGAPDLFLSFSRGPNTSVSTRGITFRKAAYSAGAWTFAAERYLSNALGPNTRPAEWVKMMYDGVRVVWAGLMTQYLVTGNCLSIVERDAADTTTTTTHLFTGLAATSTDLLASGSAAYDALQNVYLGGRDGSGATGTRKVNVRKWTRATTTLGAVTTLSSAGIDGTYLAMRRNAALGGLAEAVWVEGTASPYSVRYNSVDASVATAAYVPRLML